LFFRYFGQSDENITTGENWGHVTIRQSGSEVFGTGLWKEFGIFLRSWLEKG
jgi:hypothetical protein